MVFSNYRRHPLQTPMKYNYHIQSFARPFGKKFITLCGSTKLDSPLPYTLHTEIELQDIPIKSIYKIITTGWQIYHIDPLDLTKCYNENLLDLLHSGCDLTGKWTDHTNIGSTDLISCEFRRTHPDANIRFILRSQNKKTARLFITLWDTTPAKVATIIEDILELFSPFAKSKSATTFSISIGEAYGARPITVAFKIFHELVIRETPPLRIPKYMSSGPNDTWKVNLCPHREDATRKIVKETIKTERGTFNIQRYATEKEQRKGAKKAKREKLVDKVARQDKTIDQLQSELQTIQKAYTALLNTNEISTRKRDREIEDLQQKIEKLKRSKDFAIEKKNEEIDEIQKIAEQMLEHNNQEKISLENDNRNFGQRLQNADWQIQNLQAQVQSLRQRQDHIGIFTLPEQESEKFAGEFEIALMSALHFATENYSGKANSCKLRSQDIWQAFISANSDAEKRYKAYKQDVSQLLNASRKNNFLRSTDILNKFGIKCDHHTNNHIKIRFNDDDPRYSSTHASTPSDNSCGAKNFAEDLKNAFFYY